MSVPGQASETASGLVSSFERVQPDSDHAETASAALVAAIDQLPYDSSRRPASEELRMAWPDVGRAWITGWAHELGRDLRTVAGDLQTAAAASTEDEALVPLENAVWRLGAARDKFYAVVALAFGIPSLQIGKDKAQTLSFRPDAKAGKAKLRELQDRYETSRRILDLDGKLKQSLLLRHQATHSLAPLVKSQSLTWFEAAIVERGGVRRYEAYHLPAQGLEHLDDIGGEAVRKRAQTLAEQGLTRLLEMTSALASLLPEVAELEPPPIIWKAMETNQCFDTRDEASAVSRAAAKADG